MMGNLNLGQMNKENYHGQQQKYSNNVGGGIDAEVLIEKEQTI